MRMSQLFYYPQKEIPKDVEAISHILMVKSCMVERVASGIYDFLPLGFGFTRTNMTPL